MSQQLRLLYTMWAAQEAPFRAVHAGKALSFKSIAAAREQAIKLGYSGIHGTFNPADLPKASSPQPSRTVR